MRICIDVDGTICHLKKTDESYANVEPIPGAAKKIQKLRQAGHYIILCTARHMNTCGANIGRVVALQAETLIMWLKQHGFEYDELCFGKPYAHVYIDDHAYKFEGSWEEINPEILQQFYLEGR